MPVIRELEMGKHYDWSEIEECYPDMWIFMEEPIFNEYDDLISCTILAACEYERRDEVYAQLESQGKKFISERTISDNTCWGVFWGI